jgi:hypothetical protein
MGIKRKAFYAVAPSLNGGLSHGVKKKPRIQAGLRVVIRQPKRLTNGQASAAKTVVDANARCNTDHSGIPIVVLQLIRRAGIGRTVSANTIPAERGAGIPSGAT